MEASGGLAKAAGVSADTLRHYERKGLLRPQRSHNGYRQYPEHALERVRMIRQALAEIESHLEDVIALRNELRASLKDWDARLAQTAPGQRASLLKIRAARDSVRNSSTSLLLRKPGLKKKGKKNE